MSILVGGVSSVSTELDVRLEFSRAKQSSVVCSSRVGRNSVQTQCKKYADPLASVSSQNKILEVSIRCLLFTAGQQNKISWVFIIYYLLV